MTIWQPADPSVEDLLHMTPTNIAATFRGTRRISNPMM